MWTFFLRRPNVRLLALVLLESALTATAVVAASMIRLGSADGWAFWREDHNVFKALLVVGVCQYCLYVGEVFNLRLTADRREFFVRLVQSLGIAALLLALVYYWFPGLMLGRGVFLLAAILVLLLLTASRLAFTWLAGRLGPRERLLLLGTSGAAVDLARELHNRRHELGVEIVGFIDPEPDRVGAPVINPGVIGTVSDIPRLVRERRIDRVVVSLKDARGKLPMHELLNMRLAGLAFDHLPSVYEEFTGKIAVDNLRPSWLIFSAGFAKGRAQLLFKRSADIAVAALGSVVLLPVMGLVALAIKLTSPGPALYHQKRVGEHGREFTIHKFRSMRADAEAGTGAVWAKSGDDRITPIGAFLRRTRLDELPQLWNILRGDMSIVGPRPERPEFVKDLTEQIPFYGQRHVVKPGLTGWAQVRYTYGASVEDALEKLQYDLFYIKNMSMALDLFIIFETARTVLMRRGAR